MIRQLFWHHVCHRVYHRPTVGLLLCAALMLLLLAACTNSAYVNDPLASYHQSVTGGDIGRGKQAILNHGCGSCHTIAGVPGAHGLVGPPLTNIGERAYVAGLLQNTPDNLVHWIMVPQQVQPGSAMP